VDTGTLLSLLGDVNILLPQNNEILQYNSTSGKWENKQISGYTHKSFWRISPTTTSAQLGGPSNTTQNTLPNCIPWLATSVGVSILEFDTSIFQVNSNY